MAIKGCGPKEIKHLKELKKILVKAGRAMGFRGRTYKGFVKFLDKRYPRRKNRRGGSRKR